LIGIAQWPDDDRLDLFREAANRRGLSFDVIQKDFWVCFVLDRLFAHPEVGPGIHFKGGTSLSKCFNVIERFSEDIDLTIDRTSLGFDDTYLTDAATIGQRRKRKKSVREAASEYSSSEILPALEASIGTVLGDKESWEFTDSGDGVIRFHFPAAGEFTTSLYLQPEVRLEIGGLSDVEAERNRAHPTLCGRGGTRPRGVQINELGEAAFELGRLEPGRFGRGRVVLRQLDPEAPHRHHRRCPRVQGMSGG
jgi:hypothetical protein